MIEMNGRNNNRWTRFLDRIGRFGKKSRPKPRVAPPFMLDEDGLSVAPPEQEPLKTAFDLEPTFPIDHLPFAEPATVRGLERRSLFNRLDAAVGADVYLFQRAQRFLRHRPDSTIVDRPDVSEKLVLALSVWAWTRSRLGLEDDGLVAMGRALEWSQDAGSCLRGYVYQRSARMLLDQLLGGTSYGSPSGVLGRFIFQDILRELEEAREDHMKSERGEAAVTETVLDLGTAFTSIDEHHPGHRLLYIGLERLEGQEGFDRGRELDARSALARSCFRLGRLDEGAAVLAPIDPEQLEPRDRYLWLHLQADFHKAVGRPGSAFARRLEALALGMDHCGPERTLDDLAAVGRDRPSSPELSEEAEVWVTNAVRHLVDRVKGEEWREGIRRLGRSVLSGSEPFGGWEPVALRKRLYQTLQNELTVQEEDGTTEVSADVEM